MYIFYISRKFSGPPVEQGAITFNVLDFHSWDDQDSHQNIHVRLGPIDWSWRYSRFRVSDQHDKK